MNLKKVCCICVLFSLLAGCVSESPIDEKKKKTQTTQISILVHSALDERYQSHISPPFPESVT
ncbi:hypothetical protein O5483_26480, partial [Escherichia coli]|nr:hypothetical protein [Escherichia coli]